MGRSRAIGGSDPKLSRLFVSWVDFSRNIIIDNGRADLFSGGKRSAHKKHNNSGGKLAEHEGCPPICAVHYIKKAISNQHSANLDILDSAVRLLGFSL